MREQQQQRQQLVQGFQLYQTRNYAQNLSSRMSEGPSYQQRSQAHSRFGGGLRRTQGEIVEVQGGHIVRSTGRKDRHSKVCTSKGPRDRRVRLSAHTAIQFYDVQDRLGYDRPSKAVDWLMKNAKAAIDELAELPPWHPTANLSASQEPDDKDTHRFGGDIGDKDAHRFGGGTGERSSSALQPSLDSGSLTETFKSFFPGANSSSYVPSTSLPTGFQSYPSGWPSHADSQNQDLRLSLQSFQDPVFVQPNAARHFDANAMAQWNVAESSSGGGGNVYSVPIFGQSQFLTHRESLQSSNPTFVRAWIDPMASDHLMHSVIHPSVQSIGFASGSGSSRFCIPARIQGEQEREGVSDKPSSASSGSHH